MSTHQEKIAEVLAMQNSAQKSPPVGSPRGVADLAAEVTELAGNFFQGGKGNQTLASQPSSAAESSLKKSNAELIDKIAKIDAEMGKAWHMLEAHFAEQLTGETEQQKFSQLKSLLAKGGNGSEHHMGLLKACHSSIQSSLNNKAYLQEQIRGNYKRYYSDYIDKLNLPREEMSLYVDKLVAAKTDDSCLDVFKYMSQDAIIEHAKSDKYLETFRSLIQTNDHYKQIFAEKKAEIKQSALGRKLKDIALDKVVIDALYYERLTALKNGDEAVLNQVRDEIILYNKDINPEASDDFNLSPQQASEVIDSFCLTQKATHANQADALEQLAELTEQEENDKELADKVSGKLEVVGYAVFVAAAVSGCSALGSLADKALNTSGNIASLSAFKHSFEEWYEGEISTGPKLDLAEGCLNISQIVLAHADKVLLNGAIGQSLLPGLGMAISLAKLAHACHEHKVAHEKFQSTDFSNMK